MLDDENNSSDEDLSTTIDTSDTRAIRKQLEGLENMYSEVCICLTASCCNSLTVSCCVVQNCTDI